MFSHPPFEIKLKKDWDKRIYFEEGDSRINKYFLKDPELENLNLEMTFIGRERAVEELKNIFLDENSGGTVLVSGYRGVGKTSFVYKCVLDAKIEWLKRKKPPHVNFHVIKLDYSQIAESAKREDKKDKSIPIDPKTLLENIIKQIYRSFYRQQLCKKRLQVCYIKNVLKFKRWERDLNRLLDNALKKTYGKFIEKNFNVEQYSTQRETTFQFNLVLNLIILLLLMAALLSTPEIADASNPNALVAAFDKLRNALHQNLKPVIGGTTVLFVANEFAFKWVTKIMTREVNAVSIAHQIDCSIGSLNHDLEKIITHISAGPLLNTKTRIIIVIDELDKIRNDSDLDEIIRSFKNLFTLTPAVFVFITDKKYYDYLECLRYRKRQLDMDYSLQHTFFTHRIFLPKPGFKDLLDFFQPLHQENKKDSAERSAGQKGLTLRDYFDQVEKDPGRESYTDCHDFLEYLCFEARDHYFDFLNVIRDHICYDAQGHAVIRISEKNLGDEERWKAYFHRMIYYIFDEYRYTKKSEEHLNNLIYSKLYAVMDTREKQEFYSNECMISPETLPSKPSPADSCIEFKPSPARANTINQIIKRFLGFLVDRGAIKPERDSDSAAEKFSWTGKCKPVHKRFHIFSTEELSFLDASEPLTKLMEITSEQLADHRDIARYDKKAADTLYDRITEVRRAISERKAGVYTTTEFPDLLKQTKGILRKIAEDQLRVGRLLQKTNYHGAQQFFDQSEHIADTIEDQEFKLELQIGVADSYFEFKDYQAAQMHYNESLKLAEILLDGRKQADISEKLIQALVYQRNYDGIDPLLEKVKAYRSKEDLMPLFNKLINIADYPKSLDFMRQSTDLYFRP